MSRKHPIAVVYRIININNEKVYIGETKNWSDRFSHYRTIARGRITKNLNPISEAILEEGIDSFIFDPICTVFDDPKLVDSEYRKTMEEDMIAKYDATNPQYGYNVDEYNHSYWQRKRKKGVKHHTSTKILKSDQVIMYDTNDGTCIMFLGSQSAAVLVGAAERSVITRATKYGFTFKGMHFYKLDYDKRLTYAENIITNALTCTNKVGRPNEKARKKLKTYLKGLFAVNEWCEYFGYKTIDVDKYVKPILEQYNYKLDD